MLHIKKDQRRLQKMVMKETLGNSLHRDVYPNGFKGQHMPLYQSNLMRGVRGQNYGPNSGPLTGPYANQNQGMNMRDVREIREIDTSRDYNRDMAGGYGSPSEEFMQRGSHYSSRETREANWDEKSSPHSLSGHSSHNPAHSQNLHSANSAHNAHPRHISEFDGYLQSISFHAPHATSPSHMTHPGSPAHFQQQKISHQDIQEADKRQRALQNKADAYEHRMYGRDQYDSLSLQGVSLGSGLSQGSLGSSQMSSLGPSQVSSLGPSMGPSMGPSQSSSQGPSQGSSSLPSPSRSVGMQWGHDSFQTRSNVTPPPLDNWSPLASPLGPSGRGQGDGLTAGQGSGSGLGQGSSGTGLGAGQGEVHENYRRYSTGGYIPAAGLALQSLTSGFDYSSFALPSAKANQSNQSTYQPSVGNVDELTVDSHVRRNSANDATRDLRLSQAAASNQSTTHGSFNQGGGQGSQGRVSPPHRNLSFGTPYPPHSTSTNQSLLEEIVPKATLTARLLPLVEARSTSRTNARQITEYLVLHAPCSELLQLLETPDLLLPHYIAAAITKMYS